MKTTLSVDGRKVAEGGPVEPAESWTVGDHRPELFVPKVDGMIVPVRPQGRWQRLRRVLGLKP